MEHIDKNLLVKLPSIYFKLNSQSLWENFEDFKVLNEIY